MKFDAAQTSEPRRVRPGQPVFSAMLIIKALPLPLQRDSILRIAAPSTLLNPGSA
jgi:hypothetical protein